MTVGAERSGDARQGSRRVGVEQLRHRIHLLAGTVSRRRWRAVTGSASKATRCGWRRCPGKKHLADWEHISRGRRDEADQRLHAQRRAQPARRQLRSDAGSGRSRRRRGVAAGRRNAGAGCLAPLSFPSQQLSQSSDAGGWRAGRRVPVDGGGGPLYDASTTAGYKLLFGDLPVEDESRSGFDRSGKGRGAPDAGVPAAGLPRAAGGCEADVKRFVALVEERAQGRPLVHRSHDRRLHRRAGFAGIPLPERKARAASTTTRSPRGSSLFLWNSLPDDELRARAAKGELNRPARSARRDRAHAGRSESAPLRRRVSRLLDRPAQDGRLHAVGLALQRLLSRRCPDRGRARRVAALLRGDAAPQFAGAQRGGFQASRFSTNGWPCITACPGVKGVAMRRVDLPPDSPRGGFMTQASVLKVTANGTTTSPVLRGKWIMERILGFEIPPPPGRARRRARYRAARSPSASNWTSTAPTPVARPATARWIPPGFALESFDVMGGWRDRYRGVDEAKPAEKGLGKNGQPFAFHYALPVDSSGVLPDGRTLQRRSRSEATAADRRAPARMNLARQLTFTRPERPCASATARRSRQMVDAAKPGQYGLRTLVQQIVQSDLFRNK